MVNRSQALFHGGFVGGSIRGGLLRAHTPGEQYVITSDSRHSGARAVDEVSVSWAA